MLKYYTVNSIILNEQLVNLSLGYISKSTLAKGELAVARGGTRKRSG
jgi:hypothetical protein